MTIRLALSLATLVVGAMLSFASAPAVAGTYEDNVFRPGEPRWGSSSRHWEDRNVRPRHHGSFRNQRGHHGHAAPRSRTFIVPAGQVLIPRGICMRNMRTGEIRC